MTGLTRWDPFSDLTSMHSQLDDIFNNFLRTSLPSGGLSSAPAMDVYTNDDKELVAEVSAPGFDKDDVEVSVNEGVLEIKGEKHDRQEDGADGEAGGRSDRGGKRNYMLRESHASFYRRIALPRQADGDSVRASFENGLLRVTVPFKELPQPRKIAIEAGGGSGDARKPGK